MPENKIIKNSLQTCFFSKSDALCIIIGYKSTKLLSQAPIGNNERSKVGF